MPRSTKKIKSPIIKSPRDKKYWYTYFWPFHTYYTYVLFKANSDHNFQSQFHSREITVTEVNTMDMSLQAFSLPHQTAMAGISPIFIKEEIGDLEI